MAAGADMTAEEGFDDVVEFVRSEINPHIESYTSSYLERRIGSRLRKTKCEGYEDYLELLERDEAEREALAEAFWINVTEFFRNPEVWEKLYELFPEDEPRVLSAGCAGGREPYSLAVLSREKEVDARIDGVDVASEAVDRCRSGVYEDVDLDRFEKMSFVDDPFDHLEERPEGYAVREGLREMVSFRQADLLETMDTLRFDVVVCRNLFIYVNRDDQEELVQKITDVLDESGLLVIGKTERLPDGFDDQYETLDNRLRIYRRT